MKKKDTICLLDIPTQNPRKLFSGGKLCARLSFFVRAPQSVERGVSQTRNWPAIYDFRSVLLCFIGGYQSQGWWSSSGEILEQRGIRAIWEPHRKGLQHRWKVLYSAHCQSVVALENRSEYVYRPTNNPAQSHVQRELTYENPEIIITSSTEEMTDSRDGFFQCVLENFKDRQMSLSIDSGDSMVELILSTAIRSFVRRDIRKPSAERHRASLLDVYRESISDMVSCLKKKANFS